MKTHKNNFPNFQQIKTFFQSFFKKPIFVLKKIISLQVIDKNSVFAIRFLTLKSEKFQKSYRKSENFARMRIYMFVAQVFLRTSKADSKFAIKK